MVRWISAEIATSLTTATDCDPPLVLLQRTVVRDLADLEDPTLAVAGIRTASHLALLVRLLFTTPPPAFSDYAAQSCQFAKLAD
jgi:hypothetical protein